jgi:multiple sugar transport system substrate-binding protein
MNNMKRIKYLVFSLLLVTALILSACGKVTASEEAAAPAESEAVVAEVAEEATEPVKIGVYSLAWSTSSINMIKELIAKFNTEHEGKIEAEFIQGDWGQVENYITAGVSGGGGIADVIEYYVGGAYSWYDQDYVIDLSPYITDEVKATMPEELWKARTAEDGAVFFSGTVTGSYLLIYYHPDAFTAAGVTAPAAGETWTWPEFIEKAKMLTVDANGKHVGEDGFDAENVTQWGFMPRLDNEKIWEEGSLYAMQAMGKPLIRKGDDGKWDIFFDEPAVNAFKSYLNVIAEGVTPQESIGLTGDSQDEAFYQGKAAMVERDVFNVAVLHDNYPDFKFAVMPIPMEPNSTFFQSPTDGQGFAIPVTSEHPAEAAEFVFWFQKAENQAMWSKALMMSPVNPEAMKDPLIANNPDFTAMTFYKSIEKFVETEICPNQDEFVTTVYTPAMMEVLQGNITLDEAIAQIKAVSKDVLNQ